MKILHCSDLHYGALSGPVINGKNARQYDTLRCMEEIVHIAESETPNIVIIAGDITHKSNVWGETALSEIKDIAEKFLRPLCGFAEQVIAVYGTNTHDSLKGYELLQETLGNELPNLHIITQPDVYTYRTSVGEIQILALPGFDKGRLRTFMPDADKETENQNATALLNDVLLGLSAKLNKNIPSVLVAHYTVAGSESESGSTFLAGQDVVILPQTIDASGVTLATLGHIHKPQKIKCKSTTIQTNGNSLNHINPVAQSPHYIVRKLTPLECGRLQGFPDEWCSDVPHSDSAEYKMWGNGVALPPTLYVMLGVAEALNEQSRELE